jgi:Fe-S oxidoreductase
MERYVKELEYCTYCPKMCRHSCPVAQALGRETLTPQSKMELLNMLQRTAVPWELDYILPLYACTTCQLCTQYCRHDIDVATVLQSGRVAAEPRRLVHPRLRRLQEEFRQRSDRLLAKLHQEYSAHLFAEEARVGFFPGCDAIDTSIGDIRDALSVFDSLDLNFVRLIDAPHACAGYPLWAAGCNDAARFVAADMIKCIRRFATVVVGCAACTWLLREKLPAEGFEHNTEVLHISEFLYVHAERLDIRNTRPAAFYHDPCYLGRYLGIYEPPRRLVTRCVDSLREFFYTGEEAECCGGGGLVPLTYPEAAMGQARRRLEEAQLFDVPLVVTACPTCKRTFNAAKTEVEVLDLVNLLAWSIRDPDRAALPDA